LFLDILNGILTQSLKRNEGEVDALNHFVYHGWDSVDVTFYASGSEETQHQTRKSDMAYYYERKENFVYY